MGKKTMLPHCQQHRLFGLSFLLNVLATLETMAKRALVSQPRERGIVG